MFALYACTNSINFTAQFNLFFSLELHCVKSRGNYYITAQRKNKQTYQDSIADNKCGQTKMDRIKVQHSACSKYIIENNYTNRFKTEAGIFFVCLFVFVVFFVCFTGWYKCVFTMTMCCDSASTTPEQVEIKHNVLVIPVAGDSSSLSRSLCLNKDIQRSCPAHHPVSS